MHNIRSKLIKETKYLIHILSPQSRNVDISLTSALDTKNLQTIFSFAQCCPVTRTDQYDVMPGGKMLSHFMSGSSLPSPEVSFE